MTEKHEAPAPMIDTRPTRQINGVHPPPLMSSAATAALLSGGAEGGAEILPTPRKRALFALVGAMMGAALVPIFLGLLWLVTHGYAVALVTVALAGLGASVGWSAARPHSKQWGSDGLGVRRVTGEPPKGGGTGLPNKGGAGRV